MKHQPVESANSAPPAATSSKVLADVNWAAPQRGTAEICALETIDARLCEIAANAGASEVRYPTLIAGDILQIAEYPQAFPHLLMTAAQPRDVSRAAADLLQSDNVETSPWCLSPAVCYHTYAEFSGQTIAEPTVITARGKCFRNESARAPGIRQVEFEMREIVLLGPEVWANDVATRLQHLVEELANELQISGNWRVATDPFFLPQAQGKALIQQIKQSKLEYQGAGDNLAMASVNRHETFFGERFNIVDRDGMPVHTACVAIGLDRWLARTRVDQSSLVESGSARDWPTGDDMVLRALRRRLPFLPPDITVQTPVADLQLDSLDLVEMLYVLDEEFNVRISQDTLEHARVVGDLIGAVHAEWRNLKGTP